MMTVELKKIGTRSDGKPMFENAGKVIENRMNDIFPTWEKATPEEDRSGIDGFMTWNNKRVRVQLKVMIHPDGGLDPMHGYSVSNKTSQRKLKENVDYIILVLPRVENWGPRYKLDHTTGIVYVVKRTVCIKNKYLGYNSKGDIFLNKNKRLALENGIGDGVDPMEVIIIKRIE